VVRSRIINELLMHGLCHVLRWSGAHADRSRDLRRRAVIIAFHEIQRDHRSELMTGTSVQLFDSDSTMATLAAGMWSFTRDDGYRDTVSAALPVLERHNGPFMVYIPTVRRSGLQAWWRHEQLHHGQINLYALPSHRGRPIRRSRVI
jgi:hypothetical protein